MRSSFKKCHFNVFFVETDEKLESATLFDYSKENTIFLFYKTMMSNKCHKTIAIDCILLRENEKKNLSKFKFNLPCFSIDPNRYSNM